MIAIRILSCFCMIGCLTTPAVAGDKAKRRDPVKLTEAALAIHRDALVFDGHNDLPWRLREGADPFFRRYDLTREQPDLHTDIPRLRKGNVGAQFFVAYVSSEPALRNVAI